MGGAYQFNGSNACVFVPRSDSLNVSSQMTLSVWFKAASYGVQRPILDWNDPVAGFGAVLVEASAFS